MASSTNGLSSFDVPVLLGLVLPQNNHSSAAAVRRKLR